MKKAFSLSELLIALTIVGVIAVLTLPNVTRNAYSKSYVALLQSTYNKLDTSLREAMATQGITSVDDFDLPLEYSDETQEHAFFRLYFDVQKYCNSSLTGCFADAYKDIEGRARTDMIWKGDYVVLRNGVSVGIPEDFWKYIYVDVNNIDPPNVLGRDFFILHITERGELSSKDMYVMDSLTDMASDCKSFNGYFFTCFDYLQQNNWKMDY